MEDEGGHSPCGQAPVAAAVHCREGARYSMAAGPKHPAEVQSAAEGEGEGLDEEGKEEGEENLCLRRGRYPRLEAEG